MIVSVQVKAMRGHAWDDVVIQDVKFNNEIFPYLYQQNKILCSKIKLEINKPTFSPLTFEMIGEGANN